MTRIICAAAIAALAAGCTTTTTTTTQAPAITPTGGGAQLSAASTRFAQAAARTGLPVDVATAFFDQGYELKTNPNAAVRNEVMRDCQELSTLVLDPAVVASATRSDAVIYSVCAGLLA